MSVTRRERVVEARRLRGEGLIYREIAERLGVSLSYANDLVIDPEDEKGKIRRHRGDGTCADCGARTHSGDASPPKRCQSCATRHQKANAKWTRDSVAQAIQRWAEQYGEPPTATNWNRAQPGHDSSLVASGDWPKTMTVQKVFGSWNNAIRAAGFKPRPHRGKGRGPGWLTEEDYARTVAMWRDGMPLEGIGKHFGISGPGVRQRLIRAGALHQRRHTGRKTTMGAFATAEKVLDREIERLTLRIQKLRDEATQHDEERQKLQQARAALNGDLKEEN